LLVGGGGDGGGLTTRGFEKKPGNGDTVKSSLIQDSLGELSLMQYMFCASMILLRPQVADIKGSYRSILLGAFTI
jgi:hypothetical protein